MSKTTRICIIGAGPAGIVALKTTLDTAQFKAGKWVVDVYEARENVGGVWLPEQEPYEMPPLTPLYDSLTTNLPHPIMAFTDFPFPPSTPVYPLASAIQTYLEAYTDVFALREHIQFGSRVTDITRLEDGWAVKINGGVELHRYTHIMVTNGHYRVPRFSKTPGLGAWLAKGKANHSAWYRNPSSFGTRGTYLVIGAGPSGRDITAEIALVPGMNIVHSVSGSPNVDDGNVKTRGRVVRLLDDLTSAEFEDGTFEYGIDFCIFATGYDMVFPFLPSSLIASSPNTEITTTVYNSHSHLYPLARHLWALPSRFGGTLSFLGLPTKVAPFPLVEAQALAIVHSIANPSFLDIDQEMRDTQARDLMLKERYEGDEGKIAAAWHRFEDEEQFDYRDALNRFAVGRALEDGKDRRGAVPAWEKEVYARKDVIRRVWRALEVSGDSASWVEGVGEGNSRREGETKEEAGLREWVELLDRLWKKGNN